MSRYIISGGGTGGHIFPAIAIANAIKVMDNNAEILFVGAEGRMEMEKVPAAGYKIIGIPIAGFQRSITLKNLTFFYKLLKSLSIAKKIVKDFKPDVVIGVGGYASGPVLHVATNMKIPALIQEQNSFPGVTNKILSKKVNTICVAYPGMEKFFPISKIKLTGNPVRQNLTDGNIKIEDAISYFKLEEGKQTILSIGGSLGARTINESIYENIAKIAKNQNVQLIWQTGISFYEKAKSIVEHLSVKNIHVSAFINKMDYAYAVADIVISRAGAISISELCLVGKPAILVPSPNVSEDHQTKNAKVLVDNNAALMVKDADAVNELVNTALGLLSDIDKQNALKNNIVKMSVNNSAEKISLEIMELLKR